MNHSFTENVESQPLNSDPSITNEQNSTNSQETGRTEYSEEINESVHSNVETITAVKKEIEEKDESAVLDAEVSTELEIGGAETPEAKEESSVEDSYTM